MKLTKSTVISLILISLLITACGVDSSGGSGALQGTPNSATLSWDAPITSADGTPLTDLMGYKVYYGAGSGNYTEIIDVGSASCQDINGQTECTTTVGNLSAGDYYFVVTAYDTSGNESNYSNEVSKTIP